jgi:CheY-like chemotaxis protein
MLENFHFDVVLMNLQMPGMDGLEATRLIRHPQPRVKRHDIPIIALTANAMKGGRQICEQAGMNDYAAKPIDPQALLEAIERWCLKAPAVSLPPADVVRSMPP